VLPVRPSRTTPGGGEGEGVLDNTYKLALFQDSTPVTTPEGVKFVSILRVPDADSADVIIQNPNGRRDSTRVAAVAEGIEGLSDGPLTNEGFRGLTRDPGGSGIGDLYPELGGTNTRYSFAGQIFTARFAVNPLGFLARNPLGRNAGKVYAEAAVLGWKNYPGFYEERRERIPVMAGIFLPTFDFLDFLAVETEYFPSKQPPTYEVRFKKNAPQPGLWKPAVNPWTDARVKKDDWKWGLAAKKSFRGYALVAQAGTDHLKIADEGGHNYFDVLTRPAHWYAQLRFIAGIY
jgi:hypothetical protein